MNVLISIDDEVISVSIYYNLYMDILILAITLIGSESHFIP